MPVEEILSRILLYVHTYTHTEATLLGSGSKVDKVYVVKRTHYTNRRIHQPTHAPITITIVAVRVLFSAPIRTILL